MIIFLFLNFPLVITTYLPMQYMSYVYNVLVIGILSYCKIASGDKRGTKICWPKDKKSKYEIQLYAFQDQSMYDVFLVYLFLNRVRRDGKIGLVCFFVYLFKF